MISCNHCFVAQAPVLGYILFEYLNFNLFFCFVAAQPLPVNGLLGIQVMTHDHVAACVTSIALGPHSFPSAASKNH